MFGEQDLYEQALNPANNPDYADSDDMDFDSNEPRFLSQWPTISWVEKNSHWRFSVPDGILQKAIDEGDVVKKENNYREDDLSACIALRNHVLAKHQEYLTVGLTNRLEKEDSMTQPPLKVFTHGKFYVPKTPTLRPIAEEILQARAESSSIYGKKLTPWSNYLELVEAEDGPNILIIDIETTPLIVAVWRRFNIDVGMSQVIEDWKLLSYSYKWLHSDTVHFVGMNEFTQAEMAEQLMQLLDMSDWVIAHNGARFDRKRINTILDRHGYYHPMSYKLIDTYRIAKRHLDHTSRALDYLSQEYGGTGKVDNGGMALWLKCMENDPEAWDLMKSYNDVDVLELERVWLRLRSWDDRGPNWALYSNRDGAMCMACGHDVLNYVGKYHTITMLYDEFRCAKCGKLQRDRINCTPKEKHRFQNVVLG